MKKKKKKQNINWFEILLNKTSSHFPSFPAFVKKTLTNRDEEKYPSSLFRLSKSRLQGGWSLFREIYQTAIERLAGGVTNIRATGPL